MKRKIGAHGTCCACQSRMPFSHSRSLARSCRGLSLAFAAAAVRGHAFIVSMLVAAKAEVRRRLRWRETERQTDRACAHVVCLQVAAKDTQGMSALALGSALGDAAVVQCLLTVSSLRMKSMECGESGNPCVLVGVACFVCSLRVIMCLSERRSVAVRCYV